MADGVIDLENVLVNGLRPFSDMHRNAEYAEVFTNLLPTERRARPLVLPTQPGVGSVDWPYSQAAKLTKHWLVLGRQGVTGRYNGTLDAPGLIEAPVLYKAEAPTGEAATNPTFTGAAAPWTLGANWHYDTNAIHHHTGAVEAVTQACLTVGRMYKVTVIVTRATAGSFTVSAGTTASAAISTAGTHVLYLACAGNTTLSITPLTTFDGEITSCSALYVIPLSLAGTPNTVGPWDCAAFADKIYFLANGEALLWQMPSNDNEFLVGVDQNTVSSVVNFFGRLVFLGIDPAFSINSEWTDLFNHWKATTHFPGRYKDLVMDENMAVGTNWIAWSEPGGGDVDIPYAAFLAMFGYPDQAAYTKYKEVIYTLVESGLMGFLPLTNTGPIHRGFINGGNELAVYGTQGVSRLKWTEQGFVEVPEFNQYGGHAHGIQFRGCVGGDNIQQGYITRTGKWCFVSSKGVEEVGYEEFLNGITNGLTVVTYDPLEGHFFISDGVSCYVRTRTGLGKSGAVKPTCVFRHEGYDGLLGWRTLLADPQAVAIQTGILDSGQRGVFETTFVRLATTDTTPAGWTVALDHRMDKAAAFTRSTPVAVDGRGVARIKIPWTEHKIVLAATDRTLVDLDRIEDVFRPLDSGGKTNLRSLD
jgi:hypothetical protein